MEDTSSTLLGYFIWWSIPVLSFNFNTLCGVAHFRLEIENENNTQGEETEKKKKKKMTMKKKNWTLDFSFGFSKWCPHFRSLILSLSPLISLLWFLTKKNYSIFWGIVFPFAVLFLVSLNLSLSFIWIALLLFWHLNYDNFQTIETHLEVTNT